MDPKNIPQAAKKEAKRQLEALRRGTVQIYTEDELLAKLARSIAAKCPLRVKLGLDPTAPDIHLGHTVVLSKMRQFQDFGHKAVLIIGDYTARVGDPSGQDHTRPVLSDEQIRLNAQTYFDQAGKVLDARPERLEVRFNSEWLARLTFADVLRLAAKMTVARMLERDSFEKRHKAGDPIGVHEFLYPLMQAHDSVAIGADVELGGTDQTFNCLAGRDLMRDSGAEPQVVIAMPLLVGLDGAEKMSKSKGNTVGVTDPPGEMFGKLMSIPDGLMENYWTLLTDRPLEEVRRTLASAHPREAKEALAKAIVARHWSAEAAEAAADEFRRVFSEGKSPTALYAIRDVRQPLETKSVGVAWLLREIGAVKSNSEGMRKIQEGAVDIDGESVSDPKATLSWEHGKQVRLRMGRRYFRVDMKIGG